MANKFPFCKALAKLSCDVTNLGILEQTFLQTVGIESSPESSRKRVGSAMLPLETHLFGATGPKPSQDSVPALIMKRKPKSKGSRLKIKLGLPDLEHAKIAVIVSLRSFESQRSYRHSIDEFVAWYCSAPRLSFNKTVVIRYRLYLKIVTSIKLL
jgi:hypothetical protein